MSSHPRVEPLPSGVWLVVGLRCRIIDAQVVSASDLPAEQWNSTYEVVQFVKGHARS